MYKGVSVTAFRQHNCSKIITTVYGFGFEDAGGEPIRVNLDPTALRDAELWCAVDHDEIAYENLATDHITGVRAEREWTDAERVFLTGRTLAELDNLMRVALYLDIR